MDFTQGLFWGGIVGMIVSAVATVAVLLFSIWQKNKLRQKLNAEYGEEAR